MGIRTILNNSKNDEKENNKRKKRTWTKDEMDQKFWTESVNLDKQKKFSVFEWCLCSVQRSKNKKFESQECVCVHRSNLEKNKYKDGERCDKIL